jgi:MoxR-like ATPase
MTHIVQLVQATRDVTQSALLYGASPRGTLSIATAAKGMALLRGRRYVTPEDVDAVYQDCLRHRIILSYEALAQGKSPDTLLSDIAGKLQKPTAASSG